MKKYLLIILALFLISACTLQKETYSDDIQAKVKLCQNLRIETDFEEEQHLVAECIEHLAIKYDNINICNEIKRPTYAPGGSATIYSRETCINRVYNELAITTQDPSWCDKIDATVHSSTGSATLQTGDSNSSFLKNSCYFNLAKIPENIYLCEKIDSVPLRNTCVVMNQ